MKKTTDKETNKRIIKEIHSFYGFKHQKDGAAFFGVKPQTYCGWITHGKPLNVELIYEKVKDDIKKSWLETGNGPMLNDGVTIKPKVAEISSKPTERDNAARAKRFEKIVEYYNFKKGDAAKYFEISPQLYYGWKEGRWNFEKLYSKVRDVINADWLLYGEGEMFKVDQRKIVSELEKKVQELTEKNTLLSKENQRLIELIDAYKKVIRDSK